MEDKKVFKVYGKIKANKVQKQYQIIEIVEFRKIVNANSEKEALDIYYQDGAESSTISLKAKRVIKPIDKTEKLITTCGYPNLKSVKDMIKSDNYYFDKYKSIRIEQTDLKYEDVFKDFLK